MKGKIKVISKTKPYICGGTDASVDEGAPKKITSEEMLCFDVESSLGSYFDSCDIQYVCAFAVPAGGGTFLVFRSKTYDNTVDFCTCISQNIMPVLVDLVNKENLISNNGYHSTTHGLPENFGGHISIDYQGGEYISISDNQSPVLSPETAMKIYDLFQSFARYDKIPLPEVSKIKEIRMGSKSVTASPEILNIVEKRCMLAWKDLPRAKHAYGEVKSMTFVLEDGEITVLNDRELPYHIKNGFFEIELESGF